MQNDGEIQSAPRQPELLGQARQKLGGAIRWFLYGNSETAVLLDPEAEFQMREEALGQSWRGVSPEDAGSTTDERQLRDFATEVGADAMLEAFAPENAILWTHQQGSGIKRCIADWLARTYATATKDHRQFIHQENVVAYGLFTRMGINHAEASSIFLAWESYDIDEVTEQYEKDGFDEGESRMWAAKCLETRIADNLATMIWLEEQRPGSVRMLYDQCGIRNFGRYPAEALLAQLDLERDPAKPLNLVISDTQDRNLSLNYREYVAVATLLADGQTVFVETRFGSEAMLYAYASGMAEQHGPIDRLVFCTHASENTMGNDPAQAVTQEEIESADTFARMKDEGTLSQTAVAAVIGCRAGVENGIATALAKRANVPTFAFDADLFGFDPNTDTEYQSQSVRLTIPPQGETTWAVLIQPDGSRHIIGGVMQPLGSYSVRPSRVWRVK